VGDFNFSMISAAKNSNKYQKTRFWKEKSVEDIEPLGPTAQATLVLTISNSSWVSAAGYAGRAFLFSCLASSKTN
jgi:hypothetical protein